MRKKNYYKQIPPIPLQKSIKMFNVCMLGTYRKLQGSMCLLNFNRTILNLRFINNSLIPIPLALRTEYIIKNKTKQTQTLNLYSSKKLVWKNQHREKIRAEIWTFVASKQAGYLLPSDCCYSRKIEVDNILTFIPTDPWSTG